MDDTFEFALKFFAIMLIIFLVCRELVTWYWKINKTISIFERIADSLEEIAEHLGEQNKKQHSKNDGDKIA